MASASRLLLSPMTHTVVLLLLLRLSMVAEAVDGWIDLDDKLNFGENIFDLLGRTAVGLMKNNEPRRMRTLKFLLCSYAAMKEIGDERTLFEVEFVGSLIMANEPRLVIVKVFFSKMIPMSVIGHRHYVDPKLLLSAVTRALYIGMVQIIRPNWITLNFLLRREEKMFEVISLLNPEPRQYVGEGWKGRNPASETLTSIWGLVGPAIRTLCATESNATQYLTYIEKDRIIQAVRQQLSTNSNFKQLINEFTNEQEVQVKAENKTSINAGFIKSNTKLLKEAGKTNEKGKENGFKEFLFSDAKLLGN
ncbi:hypothetical protein AXF42_Ash004727 [Apostasia shenzhenica]|uniref:Uncharacterized protein n=1 Tax=Apostasia shenzhenica TaxID=1088818 RepID=A0A2I0BHH1_9ASPA|nr:hypothetical protein AXF42_Ash004727 [Apostasia shenzhenica]